jgi:hypothetical protein
MDPTDKLDILARAAKYDAPFIVSADYSPVSGAAPSEVLRRSLAQARRQMNLWTELNAA